MKLKLALLLIASYFLVSGGTAQESSDDGTQCGPIAHPPSMHACHCANMVEAVQIQYQEECDRKSRTRKEREACLNEMPHTCDVMDYPGGHRYRGSDGELHDAAGHPDQCRKKCHADKCSCNEGACARPPKKEKR